MKVALLGDIHGNHYALKAVLDAARQQGAERLLLTGDIVGYYFWPKEVLELLAPWDSAMVCGNHETMLMEARRNSDFISKVDGTYGTGLRIAIEQLDSRQLDMLCGLPHPLNLAVENCTILLCHGSPWDIGQYVYSDSPPEMLNSCAAREFDLVVMGHTHYPMWKQIGRTLLVNPGSVGQPRNRKPGAHWALFDTESRKLRMCFDAYCAAPLIAE